MADAVVNHVLFEVCTINNIGSPTEFMAEIGQRGVTRRYQSMLKEFIQNHYRHIVKDFLPELRAYGDFYSNVSL